MTILTVLKFPAAEGAQQMANTLLELQDQQLIEVQDAAIVTWAKGAKQPKTEQLGTATGSGALSGPFWGMLFGLIFFVPYFGPDLDAAVDALSRRFGDYGIDARFITQTRAQATEGTSAVFLLTSATVESQVVAAMMEQSFEIIATNLPRAAEDELRAVFGTE
jgi:uncharacterized membrane protein